MSSASALGSATEPVQLRLDEAIPLCTAWLQDGADARGIRLLVLKGDASSRQGLREPHASSDVDVLIEPDRFADAMRLLAEAGWSEFTDSFAAERLGLHSRTVRRVGWPNSIDVHSYWPGFLMPADEAFDVVWERRELLDFGHRACAVPDRATNVLMLALHSLRGSAEEDRHQRELEGLLRLQLTEDDRTAVASAARATKSAAPLRDVLSQLRLYRKSVRRRLRSPEYREWHRKMLEGNTAVASHRGSSNCGPYPGETKQRSSATASGPPTATC